MLKVLILAPIVWAMFEMKKKFSERRIQKLKERGMSDEQIKQAADNRAQTIILVLFLVFLVSFLVAGLRTM